MKGDTIFWEAGGCSIRGKLVVLKICGAIDICKKYQNCQTQLAIFYRTVIAICIFSTNNKYNNVMNAAWNLSIIFKSLQNNLAQEFQYKSKLVAVDV